MVKRRPDPMAEALLNFRPRKGKVKVEAVSDDAPWVPPGSDNKSFVAGDSGFPAVLSGNVVYLNALGKPTVLLDGSGQPVKVSGSLDDPGSIASRVFRAMKFSDAAWVNRVS